MLSFSLFGEVKAGGGGCLTKVVVVVVSFGVF